MKLKVEYRGGFPPGSPVSTKVQKWSLSVSRGLDCKVRLDRGRDPEGYLFGSPFWHPKCLGLDFYKVSPVDQWGKIYARLESISELEN